MTDLWPGMARAMMLTQYRNVDFMDVDESATDTALEDRRRLGLHFEQIFQNDPCNLFASPLLRQAHVPPVNSTSDSIMVVADLEVSQKVAYNKIIFKITFYSQNLNQFIVEDAVYRLLRTQNLPFVMQHIHTLYCDNFEGLWSHHDSELIRNIKDRWTMLTQTSRAYDFRLAQILVCERGQGSSLGNVVQAMPPDAWVVVFAQVVYTLAYFEEIGIMHHDMHLGNVWLDRTDNAYAYVLHIDRDSQMRFVTNLIVKLYDFDHSTIVQTGYNTFEMQNYNLRCAQWGECNRMTIGRDYAQFCWWLWRELPNDHQVKRFIERTVDPHFLQNEANVNKPGSLTWSGIPCKISASAPSCENYTMLSVVAVVKELARSFPDLQQPVAPNILRQTVHLPSCPR